MIKGLQDFLISYCF